MEAICSSDEKGNTLEGYFFNAAEYMKLGNSGYAVIGSDYPFNQIFVSVLKQTAYK